VPRDAQEHKYAESKPRLLQCRGVACIWPQCYSGQGRDDVKDGGGSGQCVISHSGLFRKVSGGIGSFELW
jgi:hypothetical protein